MLRAGEWKATSKGTWEKSWICRRDKAPVLGRVEEEVWADRIFPTPQRGHLPASYQKSVLPTASPLPLCHARVPDLEGCPQHLWEADPALACLTSGGTTLLRSSSPDCQPSGKGPQPRKARTSWPSHAKSASILRWSCQSQLPWGRAHWVLSIPASSSHTLAFLHSCCTASLYCQPPARAPITQRARKTLA